MSYESYEYVRETLNAPPAEEYWQERLAQGWQPVAVEWRRPTAEDDPDAGRLKEEVPFGLQVAADCRHLVENPQEMEVLKVILEQIVADRSLSEIAAELNRRHLRTRRDTPWTQVSVFTLMPRLVDVAPRILSTEEWSRRREKLLRLVS